MTHPHRLDVSMPLHGWQSACAANLQHVTTTAFNKLMTFSWTSSDKAAQSISNTCNASAASCTAQLTAACVKTIAA
jgi:hypothetical protein